MRPRPSGIMEANKDWIFLSTVLTALRFRLNQQRFYLKSCCETCRVAHSRSSEVSNVSTAFRK